MSIQGIIMELRMTSYSISAKSKLVFLILTISTIMVNHHVEAQEQPIGEAEFRLHCAVCHGTDGAGAGSIAGLLNVKPEQLDLTRMKIRNNNDYPYKWVYQVIDGRQNIDAHGERMMPVWGDRYSVDAGVKYGPYGNEAVIHGRILELVYFIQGIQD